MLRYLFASVVFLHGAIHFMGFGKAFQYGTITQLTRSISKPSGILWLLAALLFISTSILFLLNKESWPAIAIVAAILSQLLIITVWKDARFGTIANVIILLAAIASWGMINFESGFRRDVKSNLQHTTFTEHGLLTEADLQSLPAPVQNYLRYTGVVNQPKLKNVRIVFEGKMRDKGKEWFPFQSVQYNFFDSPARLFFMKAKMFGMTVQGYHNYGAAKASMDIRLFGLASIVKHKGGEMNKAETVTVFNDMCLMAPATLIDKRIQWEAIDATSSKAIFTNKDITISATLYFNDEGQLINFVSDDRTAVGDMKQYRFSTPVKEYKVINGRHVPTYGEAIWHYPDGKFTYGKFHLKTIEYNVAGL